jgi:hypothetical protein
MFTVSWRKQTSISCFFFQIFILVF